MDALPVHGIASAGEGVCGGVYSAAYGAGAKAREGDEGGRAAEAKVGAARGRIALLFCYGMKL